MDVIIAAQEVVARMDKDCFLLDIDLGDTKKNYESWSYSPNNIHLNSKAFVELAAVLFRDILTSSELESLDLSPGKPATNAGTAQQPN